MHGPTMAGRYDGPPEAPARRVKGAYAPGQTLDAAG